MTDGWQAPRPVATILASGAMLSSLALSADMITMAAEPLLMPEALPAVTLPILGTKAGGSISSFLMVNRVEFIPVSINPHACPYQVTVVVTAAATLLSTSATFDIYVRLAGDENGGGVVNFADLAQLRADFGKVGVPGWIPADLKSDG